MFKSCTSVKQLLGHFQVTDKMFRYSIFVAKLYNFCKSLGFETGKIMPSRAFCSDENQGYPIILITKHFRTFPFNHGQVGGIVATDRHGPHAEHGKDMLIIQASHVGYDPEVGKFGTYRRICTGNQEISASCGKLDHVLSWYDEEYKFAISNIFIEKRDNDYFLIIDNMLLNEERTEGLFVHLDKLVSDMTPMESFSTSKCFRASADIQRMFAQIEERTPIGKNLLPEYFRFKRIIHGDLEGRGHLERNLLTVMPWIVTAKSPLLAAAQINTQVEFDRTFRTIVKEKGYSGKRVMFISGIHIDISPSEGQLFPLTKFVPWAAFVQSKDGTQKTLEQDELFELLDAQSSDNPDQIDMEEVIQVMENAQEVKITQPAG